MGGEVPKKSTILWKKNTNLYTVSSERTWLAKGLGYLWNMALQTYENIKFKLDIYKAP